METISSQNKTLDTSPDKFGTLRASTELAEDGATLRNRLTEDGYLFLPGYLNRGDVAEARQLMLGQLRERGFLDLESAEADMAAKEKPSYFMPDLAANNPFVAKVLYDGAMIRLFERIFEEDVCHFDFTWIRAVTPGVSTAPHCDVVYMGRGTHELLTAWTPFGDIPISMGGLIVLENSHRNSAKLNGYLQQDVDSYCENGPNAEKIRTGKMGWEHWDGSFADWDGAITHDPVHLQNTLGGRWLTSDYRMGDVLIFTMRTIHASLDNRSQAMRLSSDTRYQPASLPVDERWIGENPIAHGLAGKKGKIC